LYKAEVNNRRKRLAYQSYYRGNREVDQLIGVFVKQNIDNLSESELDDLEILLKEQDTDLYNYLTNLSEIPMHLVGNQIIARVKIC
jgi:antitoxin CptB